MPSTPASPRPVFGTSTSSATRSLLNVEPRSSGEQVQRSPSKQYVSPSEIVALRGHLLELHCVYGGTPEPQISWKKRGGDLSPERVSYPNNGRTLKLDSINLEDEDTYECEASNGVGEVQTHAIHVKVEAEPTWPQVPDFTVAARDESVTFNCSSSGVPEPELRWFMNGVPIEMLEDNSNMRLGSDRFSLTIENLRIRDTAVYQCNASNIHGYAFRNFFLNVVEERQLILEPPEPLTVGVVMSKATLRCRVLGAARPELKWTKESQELVGGRYHILDSGDLQIDGLTFADQGEYTCSARDKSRNYMQIRSGRLEVKRKTRIIQPPQDYEVASGKAATFRCYAEADPSLELNVPGRPRLVRVECRTRDVLLEWQPTGDGHAPILSYSVQYNTSFSPDAWEDAFAVVPASDTKFTLSMSPWANYSFRVVARNKVGSSPPSETSETCTTPEDVPYKNPDHVMGRGERPDNLVVTWTPMPPP
ncbi:hypothetical protein MTO96_004426 [Rhipicephalus appendiculatus]